MPDEPIKLLLLKNEAFQPVDKTNIWWIYILCVIIEVFFRPCQLIELFIISILRQPSQVIRQLMVPGNYLDIRIVKLCHLLIIITHTCNRNSYQKKPKCLRQYIGQYSVNADQSCMLSSQINPDSTRAKHRFEWYGNYLNDSYRQYNTYTDVWGGFWPIK